LSTHLCLGLPSGFFSYWFSHKYVICIFLRPHSCYMPCPFPLPPWLVHSNYTWRIVQVMKLLITDHETECNLNINSSVCSHRVYILCHSASSCRREQNLICSSYTVGIN
jgi:hypothetical protein